MLNGLYDTAENRVAPEKLDILASLSQPTTTRRQRKEVVMRRIPLTQGKFALVDDADYERLSKYKWYYTSEGYARRDETVNHRHVPIHLHNEILSVSPNQCVHHKNGNALDNRRRNLCGCEPHTHSHLHQPTDQTGGSRFRGVGWYPRHRQWQARIRDHGRCLYLGGFTEEADAARAYDRAARRIHGIHARCNFGEEVL